MSDDLSALDRVHQTHPDARYQITASGPWAGSPMIFTAELGKGFEAAEAEEVAQELRSVCTACGRIPCADVHIVIEPLGWEPLSPNY